MLPKKSELVMEKERVRLKRTVNAVFSYRKYDLFWSQIETSYYDGKDLYVKYDLTNFFEGLDLTAEELRLFRAKHAFHERGHMEIDDLTVYTQFIRDHSSNNPNDWDSNIKYPAKFVQSLANMLVDGRMEHLIGIIVPYAEPYFEFGRQLRTRGALAYVLNTSQFMTLFSHRSHGLAKLELFRTEVLELLDSVRPLMAAARKVHSTKECLYDYLKLILPQVWPTFYSWAKEEGTIDPASGDYQSDGNDESDSHDKSVWADDETVAAAISVLVQKLQDQEDAEKQLGQDAGDQPGQSTQDQQEQDAQGQQGQQGQDTQGQPEQDDPVQKLINKVSKELQDDEQSANDDLAPYEEQELEVLVNTKRFSYADKVSIKPLHYSDIAEYHRLASTLKPHILGATKAFKVLLQSTDDELLVRQRSGKLSPHQMWRGELLNDLTFFNKKIEGTPATGVRISVMTDISGSTGCQFRHSNNSIIHEMKKCLVMLAEATHKVKIPTSIHAFTSDDEVEIFPIKPFGRFGNIEKGFIGGLHHKYANRDTMALQYSIDEMKKHSEEVRVIFMISDGQPCFNRGENEDTMRQMVLQAEKQGINVICLYCGPEDKNILNLVSHMYPGGAISVSHNIGRDLTGRLKKIISKRK